VDCTDHLRVQFSKSMHATRQKKKEAMRIIEKGEPPGGGGLNSWSTETYTQTHRSVLVSQISHSCHNFV
jgi:hypothetical protein